MTRKSRLNTIGEFTDDDGDIDDREAQLNMDKLELEENQKKLEKEKIDL